MTSRVQTELNQHRENLEKLISADSDEVRSNEERINDLLKVLSDVSMTIELLKETNIGQTLQDIKNKFPDLPVAILAKKVIAKWRKDCKDVEGGVKKSEEVNGGKKVRPATQLLNVKKEVVERDTEDKGNLSRAKSFDDDEWNEDHYDRLSEVRRKVNILFLSFYHL
jgi:hypothetical protein